MLVTLELSKEIQTKITFCPLFKSVQKSPSIKNVYLNKISSQIVWR